MDAVFCSLASSMAQVMSVGPDWNISILTIGWVTMTVCRHIHGPQRMNPTDLHDPCTCLFKWHFFSLFWFVYGGDCCSPTAQADIETNALKTTSQSYDRCLPSFEKENTHRKLSCFDFHCYLWLENWTMSFLFPLYCLAATQLGAVSALIIKFMWNLVALEHLRLKFLFQTNWKHKMHNFPPDNECESGHEPAISCRAVVFLGLGSGEASQTFISAKISQVITLYRLKDFSIVVVSWGLKHFCSACWKWSGIPLLWELSVNLGPFPKFKFSL